MIKKNKILVLKVGTDCNLECPGCHSNKFPIKYNNDIIPYIRNNKYTHIRFSGGEPLLYFSKIKYIMRELGDNYTYSFVTNGTKITSDMVDFLNEYDCKVSVSFNGHNYTRDQNTLVRYPVLNKLNHCSMISTVFNDNNNLMLINEEAVNYVYKHKFKSSLMVNTFLNLAHETENTDFELTEETIINFCVQFSIMIDMEINACLHNNVPIMQNQFLKHAFNLYYNTDEIKNGVKCCNETKHTMTLNGDFLICSYMDKIVGDIYSDIDYTKVMSYLPDRCKDCELFKFCKNNCVMNKTDHECGVFKYIHTQILYFIKKYDLSI